MSNIPFDRLVCRDRIMVRPTESAAPKSRVISAPTNSTALEIAYVEVGCPGIPNESEVVVEAGVLAQANQRTLGGKQVVVVPLSHVIAVAPPAGRP